VTARVLDGKAIAAEVVEGVKERVAALVRRGIQPCLTFVMIGDSPPTQLYATRLEKLAARAGIQFVRHLLPEGTTVEQLEQEIATVSADPATDGVLVQMPLPAALLGARVSALIDPIKDVDGVTIENAGRLYLGLPGQTPSTAAAIMQTLESSGIEVLGKHAVVVGRSKIVGHPVAELLLWKHATITVTHTRTRDLGSFTRRAEIIIAAAGKPALLTADMVTPGAVIIDAGTNVTESGLVGDVDFAGCKEVASAITPVPGGIGPVTNAVLIRHVIDSADQRRA
jgi:methylenetetrahydrofolate dehydrogenase (NADP+) / methenyltetrahydrofolate cyclohydrolase